MSNSLLIHTPLSVQNTDGEDFPKLKVFLSARFMGLTHTHRARAWSHTFRHADRHYIGLRGGT